MTDLSRAELYAFLATTRTPGWAVVARVLSDLKQTIVDEAMECPAADTLAMTHEARGARKLEAKFKQTVAGLPDHLSETASD